MFGELLAAQFVEMWERMGRSRAVRPGRGRGRQRPALARHPRLRRGPPPRLLRARPAAPRRAKPARAGARSATCSAATPARLAARPAGCPTGSRGVVFANELLDALPPHLVVMRDDGLREVYVGRGPAGRLARTAATVEGRRPRRASRSTSSASARGSSPGWFAEVNLAAADWVRDAGRAPRARLPRARRLRPRGARRLYSASHAAGTLDDLPPPRERGARGRARAGCWSRASATSPRTWTSPASGSPAATPASSALGTVDQTYFLLGLGLGRPAAGGRRRRRRRDQAPPGAEDAAAARRHRQHAQGDGLRASASDAGALRGLSSRPRLT